MNQSTQSTQTPHRWAEVIKAWADGCTVQYKAKRSEIWHDCGDDEIVILVTDMYDREWRIKPHAKTGWINVYSDEVKSMKRIKDSSGIYESREAADEFCVPGRIACIQITYTEGEGLEGN